MKKIFEHFLLSLLLTISVFLGLLFWLNTKFGFNMFDMSHWNNLAQLQASHSNIDKNFYISFGVAFFVWIAGLFLINRRHGDKKTSPQQPVPNPTVNYVAPQNAEPQNIPMPNINLARPPKLNLPKNIAEIAAQQNAMRQTNPSLQQPTNNYMPQQQSAQTVQQNPYNAPIAEIFNTNSYLVKPTPTISGFTPNLFAIGNGEHLWIGGVDSDINALQNAINKLQSVFNDTLEDIPITIHAFLIDNMKRYTSTNNIMVFYSLDELRNFVAAHPAQPIADDERDNFNAYSDYINTIIQYIKNI